LDYQGSVLAIDPSGRGSDETAYAVACDVAAADSKMGQEELRMLQEIRYELNVDRLHGAAIETAARARFRTLT
jgi:tellurite resistance protein